MRIHSAFFVIILVFSGVAIGQVTEKAFAPKRSLSSYFPFTVPDSVEGWKTRKSLLRDHLLTNLGLNPLPEKCNLNAEMGGKIDQGEYTIEKVRFESMPGFFVTGNLYRPKNITQPVPAILSPHGHHRDGRFRKANEAEIDAQIQKGGESFRDNARSPLQARCAHLAKMGCIVFHYDMIGYADSQQISYQIAHGFANARNDLNQPDRYGFFSPMAELQLQSIMGLQTWNSIRALDFLESIPEVDQQRIGVTGASGGGTQTFMLCAVDDRPAVCFPAVMVSTAMQGGCTCENCSNLRTFSGNVEFAAMFAPKPMGLTAADDWTIEMETKGFPELKALYSLLGSPNNVELTARLEFEHNYNQVSRESMYRLFDRHFDLNSITEESEIKFVEPNQLSVWTGETRPNSADVELEVQLLQHWARSRREKLNQFAYDESKSTAQRIQYFRHRVGDLLGSRISPPSMQWHRDEPRRQPAEFGRQIEIWKGEDDAQNPIEMKLTIQKAPTRRLTLIVGQNEKLKDQLLKSGFNVAELNLIPGVEKNALVNNGREAAGYTFGYNLSLFAARVRQLIAVTQALSQEARFSKHQLILVGTGKESATTLVAASQLNNQLQTAVLLDIESFSFEQHNDLKESYFFPGGTAFGESGYWIATSDLPIITTARKESLSKLPKDFREGDSRVHLSPTNAIDQLINELTRD